MTSPSREAGRRCRVSIERGTERRDAAGDIVRDAAGEPVRDWVELSKWWANIRFQSGMSSIRSEAPTSVARASLRGPLRRDVEPGMRIVRKGTIFKVLAVLPDEERRGHMDLVCEVVNG